MRPPEDTQLVQLADSALAHAAQRSGHWLACKPGCHQCCVGVFSISTLDAERLRDGLISLTEKDFPRAEKIRSRVQESLQRLRENFPGNFEAGTVNEADPAFEDFGNDEICPVLDPATGTCDLYASRPMTCRTFGPPVRNAEGIGMCELCFVGAPEEAIRAAEMDVSFLEEDERLSQQIGGGPTLIALALRDIETRYRTSGNGAEPSQRDVSKELI